MNIFLINLEHRKDRLKNSKDEFEKLNLDFIRFDAIYHNIGQLGCTLSHIKCLEIAKEKKYPYCMICEDDVKFIIELLQNYIYNL